MRPQNLLLCLLAAAPSAHAQVVDVLARDDRFVIAENAAPQVFAVAANDRPGNLLSSAVTLTITAAPVHGSASVHATPGSIRYTAAADFSGDDVFAYRICDDEGDCDEAVVSVLVRPHGEVRLSVDATSGRQTLATGNLRALPGARFAATPLAPMLQRTLAPTVDSTPQTPWDGPSGVDWALVTMPARSDGRDVEHRVFFPAGAPKAGQMLLVGVDDDGDGLPEAGETRCSTASASCEMSFVQRADAPVAWWMLVHNVDAPAQDVTITAFAVPMLPGDGSLVATGPGRLPRDADFGLWLGWDDESLMGGSQRAGFVRVADGDTPIGLIPVVVAQSSSLPAREALALVPGREQALALPGSRSHRTVFVDVPPGATRLRVRSVSAHDVDLALVRMPAQPDSNSTQVIPADPAWPVQAVDTGAGGDESVQVSGAALSPGRWYVVVTNNRNAASTLTLHTEIDGSAPPIGRGSWFNELRSGSGLFLYPAGSQLAGLWYTYVDDQPTWYYLQAGALQANGQWRSAIFRSAWDGDSNTLTAIGELSATPDGGGNLLLTYRIDGRTGSETMVPFGSGCPVIVATEADLSSNWFDPARAGSGYSVQLFPNYEFYAGFFYDSRGIARFAAAEFSGSGGVQETLDLQQLSGACPTCAYVAPVRTDIGTLARRILFGQFEHIDVALQFAPPLSGTWNVRDHIELLGGPGSTQGCD